jgi:hypothetical protein
MQFQPILCKILQASLFYGHFIEGYREAILSSIKKPNWKSSISFHKSSYNVINSALSFYPKKQTLGAGKNRKEMPINQISSSLTSIYLKN